MGNGTDFINIEVAKYNKVETAALLKGIDTLNVIINRNLSKISVTLKTKKVSPEVIQQVISTLKMGYKKSIEQLSNKQKNKINTYHAQATTAIKQIADLINENKSQLAEETPVSQSRKRYFAGTHSNHGATKHGWRASINKSTNSIAASINNSFPDRVRFVEHGFKRPKKHTGIAGYLHRYMMWQMDTNKKVVKTSTVRAMAPYPGKFIVKQAKDTIENVIASLSKATMFIDEYKIEYGSAYTY